MNNEVAIRPLRVLVVENHLDTLESLKLYLEDSGHEVLTSTTLRDAASLFSARDFDVLICDIGLPDGTGWELMELISRHPRRIFAVAMSGFGMNADSSRSRAAGFRSHLLKPFKVSELDKLLAEAAEDLP